MKLSILIPTYNYDCSHLVLQLLEQLPEDAEIIVGDDCSAEAFQLPTTDDRVHIYRPEHNLGRASIRNRLAEEARGEWLLFIDADAEVKSRNFIADYLTASDESQVVCGGTGNLPECPRPEARLRYDYEVAAEKRLTLSYRRQHPYAQFTTFNFLIKRNLFLSIRFDESLKQYGHEDTQFGLELKKRNINVLHIENKLIHLGLEDAEDYLQKTETALRTLATMSSEQKQNVRVSKMAIRLKRLCLLDLTCFFFRLAKSSIRKNLLGKHPNQQLFTFYKLGFYSCQVQTTRG